MPSAKRPPQPPRIKPPTAAQVQFARAKAGLTQSAAAAIVHSTGRRWREWETATYRMHPGLWELFMIRTQAIILVEPDFNPVPPTNGDAP